MAPKLEGACVELAGSVVLITGASSGIGRASASALARQGARVLVSGRDKAALAEVAGSSAGVALPADLSGLEGPAACADLAARAIAVHGRVDALVSSAGIGASGAFEQLSPESIVNLAQVNLVAPLLLARALLPGMLQRRFGHLLMIGSIAGLTGVANEAVYAATKAGLSVFMESLWLECYGRGVGVSSVVPGVVRTAFFDRRGVPYERRWPRPIAPERIADAVVEAIKTGRAETVLPKWLSFASKARGVSPSGYRLLARRFGNN
jgi:short-subunit dehydrogenase